MPPDRFSIPMVANRKAKSWPTTAWATNIRFDSICRMPATIRAFMMPRRKTIRLPMKTPTTVAATPNNLLASAISALVNSMST